MDIGPKFKEHYKLRGIEWNKDYIWFQLELRDLETLRKNILYI